MPDQSLDQQTNPTAATPSATPDDTSANHPEAASEASRLANAPVASEGQIQQADVTINRDPSINSADGNEDPGTGGGDNYDDESAWPYRSLQQEAKHRDLDASGKRDELVARLREADGDSGNATQDGPAVETALVNPTSVENGGINKTDRGIEHAGVLQSLSAQRRAQQLAVVRERSARSEDASV